MDFRIADMLSTHVCATLRRTRLTLSSLLTVGQRLPPWLPIVLRPTFLNTFVVDIGYVDMHQVNTGRVGIEWYKTQDQDRVRIIRREVRRAPALHDQLVGDCRQGSAGDLAAERTEFRPGLATDYDRRPGESGMRARAEIHIVKLPRGCGHNDALLD